MTVKASSLAADEGIYPEKGVFLHDQARSSGKGGLVHIQVLRIRKEDSHIGEDRVSGFRVPGDHHQRGEMLGFCCRKESELEFRCSPLSA